MVHVDLKKLRKIPAGGGYAFLGRAEGGRNSHADKTGVLNAHYNPVRGYGYVHAAVNDHSRLAYAEVLGDERAETAAAFWRRASAWFAGYGITIDRVLTDNGNCYRSHLWRHTLHDTGARPKYIRPRRPQTNGKVERFNRTLLEEWVYAKLYRTGFSSPRGPAGVAAHYNHHRCG
jgi:transposase InsO family protein